jgi:hypothetical protein
LWYQDFCSQTRRHGHRSLIRVEDTILLSHLNGLAFSAFTKKIPFKASEIAIPKQGASTRGNALGPNQFRQAADPEKQPARLGAI